MSCSLCEHVSASLFGMRQLCGFRRGIFFDTCSLIVSQVSDLIFFQRGQIFALAEMCCFFNTSLGLWHGKCDWVSSPEMSFYDESLSDESLSDEVGEVTSETAILKTRIAGTSWGQTASAITSQFFHNRRFIELV